MMSSLMVPSTPAVVDGSHCSAHGGYHHHPSSYAGGEESHYSHNNNSRCNMLKAPSDGGLSSNSTSQYSGSNQQNSNKKRSRRRRKGKSRSKVEPITSPSPTSKGKGAGSFFQSSASKAPLPATPTTNHSSCCGATSKKHHDAPMTKRDLYFALDCEMVGVGPDGLTSAVGRVTIVNWENQIVLDTYVEVPAPVTDYRTHVSGITPEHLQPRPGHSLMTFPQVRSHVQAILRGKILIGHGLENDLQVLGLYHPWTDIRDTATYSYFMREFRDPVTGAVTLAPKKLRDLTWEALGRQIQNPGAPHCPMEDAIAALDLYKEVRGQWEDYLIKLSQQKEKEQQQELLMEQRKQQQAALVAERQRQALQRQAAEQQRQQQQQQMRKWQWLASTAPNPPQPLYPCQPGMVHPSVMQQPMPPNQPPPSYGYRSAGPGPVLILQNPSSAAAAAYLQPSQQQQAAPQRGPPPRHQQQQQQQSSMRSSSSSWFGFSRRSRNASSSRHHPHHHLPRSVSQESITTQGTLTTVQSSFSQDYSAMPTPRTPANSNNGIANGAGTWFVEEEDEDDFHHEQPLMLGVGHNDNNYHRHGLQFASEESLETSLETTDGLSLGVIVDSSAVEPPAFVDHSEAPTDTTQEETSATLATLAEDVATLALPKDYEPPRYFTNPDPEPNSSSSWFKLFSSSSKNNKNTNDASSTKGNTSDESEDYHHDDDDLFEENFEKSRRSSDSEAAGMLSSSIFSGRLFPRRASENCLVGMAELAGEVDEHARSLH